MSPHARAGLVSIAAVLIACGATVGDTGGGAGPGGWTFTDEKDLGIQGVSPGATVLPSGAIRLYVTSPDGGAVYEAPDGLAFQPVANVTVPGSDPTVLLLPGNVYRIYYVLRSLDGVTRTIVTATSTDGGLRWNAPASTGISDSSGTRAWGVPAVIRTPAGTFRMYWVASFAGQPLEVVQSATSTDGVTFLPDAGFRATGGYVDPQIVKAEPGDWVALFSTTPGRPPQALHLATSSDGLAWSVDAAPIFTLPGRNVLDPVSVRLDPTRNLFRIYYSASDGADPLSGTFRLRSGVLEGP